MVRPELGGNVSLSGIYSTLEHGWVWYKLEAGEDDKYYLTVTFNKNESYTWVRRILDNKAMYNSRLKLNDILKVNILHSLLALEDHHNPFYYTDYMFPS